jgi:excisionase family DNA binding protein
MTDANDLLDINEAAQLLNVSEASLRRWTNAGVLPCLRIGRRRERRFLRGDLLAFMEQPADTQRSTKTRSYQPAASTALPLDGAITLTKGGHLCGLFANDLGRATLAVRFILDGLQEGSMVYVAASERAIKSLSRYLKDKRPSLDRDLSDGMLFFSEYQKGPRAQIKEFEAHLNMAARAGTQSFRVFGDTWEMRRQLSAERFAEYEATYDQLIVRRFPVVTLCAYDVRRFSGVDVLDALKTHRDTFRYPLERALA